MKSMSRATVPAGVSLFLVGAFLADMLVAEGPGGKEGGFRGHGGKRGLRGDRGVLYFAGGMGCVSGSRPRGACCPLQREFARGPLRVGGGGGSCRMAPGGDEFFDRFGFYEEDAQPLAPAESGPDTDNGVPFDPSKVVGGYDLDHVPLEDGRDVDPLEVLQRHGGRSGSKGTRRNLAREKRQQNAEKDRLRGLLEEITKIGSDPAISEAERIRRIRDIMPPPISPAETEPGMHGETLVARSFAHLNDLLFLDSWEELTGKYRPLKLYRGVPDNEMQLLTSLQRLIGKNGASVEAVKRIELGMIESFKKYAYGTARLDRDATLWEWLALAQHHGLPTRLLDWTKSPYVALHFATNKADLIDKDSVVWVIDPYRYSMEHESFREYNEFLAANHGQRCWGIFNMAQLDGFHTWKTGKTKGFTSPSDADALQLPFIFIEPPSLSRRVVNQWGCFCLIRTGEDVDRALTDMRPSYQNLINRNVSDSEGRHSHVYRKIIIPASLKSEVRDKLDAIGFTERTLFPGLDGLCAYLRRYYSSDQAEQLGRALGPEKVNEPPGFRSRNQTRSVRSAGPGKTTPKWSLDSGSQEMSQESENSDELT